MRKGKFLILMLLVSLLASCGTTTTVPITGRKHTLLVNDQQILSLSQQEYNKFLQSSRKSTNSVQSAMVQRVGQKLATAVESYLRVNGMESEIKNFAWEFNLVQGSDVNAFCMPGGKIAVYEGLLPVTRDEASLAIVIGHEIAHAVAKHSAEQMSKKMRQSYGSQIGGTILGAIGGNTIGSLAQTAANQYFSFQNLKYSRTHEIEADHIGLIFAAMAGYDPRVAVDFWKRMAAQSSKQGSDMFSSHPSDDKRIAAIQRSLPEALAYYQQSQPATPAVKSGTQTTTTTKKTSGSVSASKLYK
ncbi:MAG: M48 family metallopeptidase, partial [Prevotella sp.]|nr:M48 family metallopeptidase [Prevotella sp.]